MAASDQDEAEGDLSETDKGVEAGVEHECDEDEADDECEDTEHDGAIWLWKSDLNDALWHTT